ncbi:MAG TPA: type II toxin-antitoxin system HicA family toxin [Candidatus Elarobacter sp.]|jgi:predicted RNA binding protein YcfA (HicA-like mRNA interferase family)|nr:type II toxin-antitoxin system HicA family toxin [Candidatus Elarobacter sp.]
MTASSPSHHRNTVMTAAGHDSRMTARALIAYAKRHGWRLKRRGKGSHLVFEHPERRYGVVIPDHGSKDVPRGLMETTLKQIDGVWSKRT